MPPHPSPNVTACLKNVLVGCAVAIVEDELSFVSFKIVSHDVLHVDVVEVCPLNKVLTTVSDAT